MGEFVYSEEYLYNTALILLCLCILYMSKKFGKEDVDLENDAI